MTDDDARLEEVQDNVREKLLADLLKLKRSERRTGSDARDEDDNRYELKTVTTRGVTTGRDVGMTYLARLRRSFMIAAKGVNTEYGFRIEELYFLSPAMLEEWILKYESIFAVGTAIVERAVADCRQAGWTEEELAVLTAIGMRGITKNNPKISWSYVKKHGLRIGDPPAVRLRELVAAHPIAGGPAPVPGSVEELAVASDRTRELVDEG